MSALAKRLGTWLFYEPRALWLGLLAPIGTLSAATALWRGSELAVRSAGFIMTLAGIFLVVRGLSDKRKLFGIAAPWSRAKGWIARLPVVLKGRRITGEAHLSMDAILASDSATAWVIPSATASLEHRVEALEGNLRSTATALEDLKSATFKRFATLDQQHAALADEVRTRLTDLQGKLENVSVGSLDFDTAGVLWVVTGAVLTTFPSEVSGWIFSTFFLSAA